MWKPTVAKTPARAATGWSAGSRKWSTGMSVSRINVAAGPTAAMDRARAATTGDAKRTSSGKYSRGCTVNRLPQE